MAGDVKAPPPLTEADLAAIDKALAATTGGADGFWKVFGPSQINVKDQDSDLMTADCMGDDSVPAPESQANARWIAASKTHARRLLAEVRWLRRLFAEDFCADTDTGKDALARARELGRREGIAEAARLARVQANAYREQAKADVSFGAASRARAEACYTLREAIAALPDTPPPEAPR